MIKRAIFYYLGLFHFTLLCRERRHKTRTRDRKITICRYPPLGGVPSGHATKWRRETENEAGFLLAFSQQTGLVTAQACAECTSPITAQTPLHRGFTARVGMKISDNYLNNDFNPSWKPLHRGFAARWAMAIMIDSCCDTGFAHGIESSDLIRSWLGIDPGLSTTLVGDKAAPPPDVQFPQFVFLNFQFYKILSQIFNFHKFLFLNFKF